MCTSFYLGALRAAADMADALGLQGGEYRSLYEKGRRYAETKLFNGEYFAQETGYDDLLVRPEPESEYPEAVKRFEKEGPHYQYGGGCLSNGLAGVWLSWLCGLEDVLDRDKVFSHLRSVYKYNYHKDLRTHVNPQRPGYAFGNEGGMVLCSWPHGGRPSLPFIYSDEVWTGIEYEEASHLIAAGYVREGLEIVRTCWRRYDGTVRNPFNEYECGHYYARAMASYALLQAFSGAFYDAVTKTLYISPRIEGDFKCFFAAEGGYGLVGIRNGTPFLDVMHGKIDIARIERVRKP